MGGETPLISIPGMKKPLQVHTGYCVATITCSCGHPTPINVYFLPGVPLTAFCEECKTGFRIARFIFDIEKDGQVNVAVMELAPTVVKASGPLPPFPGGRGVQ
jgi:hypothetical protein